ncbi:MAG: anti-sigma factor [Gemmatimonadota bacterium]
MSAMLAHDELRAMLAAEALGALAGPERDALLAHVAGCEECARELASLRDAASELALAVRPVPLDPERSAGIRARLLARAAAERASPDAADEPPDAPAIPLRREPAPVPARRAPRAGWWAAAAAVALLVGAYAWAVSLNRGVEALRGRLAAVQAEREALRGELRRRESALDELAAPGVRVIDVASPARRAPSGRMFWNPATGTWTFFAHDLPPVADGREYQLWLVTPAGPRSAGTFRPDARGEARVSARYDLPADSLRAVAVTEEPAGGLPAPSGEMVVVGTFSTR